eukprot:COSAG06_NODE_2417_length_6906_cov_8.394803_4_plen_268_part_00
MMTPSTQRASRQQSPVPSHARATAQSPTTIAVSWHHIFVHAHLSFPSRPHIVSSHLYEKCLSHVTPIKLSLAMCTVLGHYIALTFGVRSQGTIHASTAGPVRTASASIPAPALPDSAARPAPTRHNRTVSARARTTRLGWTQMYWLIPSVGILCGTQMIRTHLRALFSMSPTIVNTALDTRTQRGSPLRRPAPSLARAPAPSPTTIAVSYHHRISPSVLLHTCLSLSPWLRSHPHHQPPWPPGPHHIHSLSVLSHVSRSLLLLSCSP